MTIETVSAEELECYGIDPETATRLDGLPFGLVGAILGCQAMAKSPSLPETATRSQGDIEDNSHA